MRYNEVMRHVTADTLQQLAKLSALELSQEEVGDFSNDIEQILGYIDQLADLQTDGVEPTYQVTGLSNVWRQDKVDEELLSRESLLELTQGNASNNQIRVPKVL